MTEQIILIIFSFAAALSGIIGVLLPMVPGGVPLVWLGAVLFSYATGFTLISWAWLSALFVLAAITVLIDIFAPILGAKKFKASRAGILGSFAGLLLGILILGPIGIILGPFLGTLIGEIYWSRRQPEEALRSAGGTLIGGLIGGAVKLAIALGILGFMIAALLQLIF